MKKSVRKVHVDGQEWKYVVEDRSGGEHLYLSLRIYDPFRKLHRFKIDTEGRRVKITPSFVKNTILSICEK